MSYRDHVNDLNQAFNRRRARYTNSSSNKQIHNDKGHDFVLDLTRYDELQKRHDEELRRRQLERGRPVKGNLKSTIGNNAAGNNQPTFTMIPEDKEGSQYFDPDDYETYDPEPDADNFLINNGATITYSGITLTDSTGRNRTVLRRKRG